MPSSQILLYLRPSDPQRSAIATYGEYFLKALNLVPDMEVVDFLPSDLKESVEAVEDRDAILSEVERLAEPYSGRSVIVLAESGNALHREFWAMHQLFQLLPMARFLVTIHDPPILCSNPMRYVRTNYHGGTPLRSLDVLLTKGAEFVRDRGRRRVERYYASACDTVLALTHAAEHSLEATPLFRGGDIRHIPHICTIDLKPIEPGYNDEGDGTGEVLIVFFGFICPGRGIEELVDAFEMLSDRLAKNGDGSSARLRIAGGVSQGADFEPYLKGLSERIAGSRWAERIDFTPGWIEDGERDALIHGTDIQVIPFLQTARSAFCSGSAIRAMAMGKAIVAAQTNTLEEEIVNGETGLTYPEGETEMLAEKLFVLHGDPELRRRLGGNAYAHICQEHSPQAIAAKMEPLLR